MTERLISARRKIVLGVLVLAVLVAAWQGWRWYSNGRFIESTDNAYIEADISVVSPKVSGYIEEVVVTDNQRVRRGDLLARLRTDDFRARLDETQTAVAVAQASQATALADLAQQDAAIAQARAGIDLAQAAWQRATSDLARYQALSRAQYASVQKMQAVIAEERETRAQLEQARAALALACSQTQVLQAKVKQADAAILQASAKAEEARIDLAATQLRAAIDGVVGNRSARPGQYVRAGTQMMAIVPVQAPYVIANFKETQLSRIRSGQPVELEIDAYPDLRLTGHIESLAPAAGSRFALLPPENATGNFTRVVARVPVKISIDRGGGRALHLAPGMSLVASVDTRADSRDTPSK